MSKKYFIILGLFLVAGFLFLNIYPVKAATITFIWNGAGDGTTWTDCTNWNMGGAGCTGYPGATSSPGNIINATVQGVAQTIYATTTIPSLDNLTLGATNLGSTLVIGNGKTLTVADTVTVVGTSTLKLGNTSWGSGTLSLAKATGAPLTLDAAATFTSATGTVNYFGSAAEVTIATTTYYNLSLATTTTSDAKFVFGSPGVACVSTGCRATTTVSNVLAVDTTSIATIRNSALVFTGAATSSTPFVKRGGFISNGSLIKYSLTLAGSVATGTYENLNIAGQLIQTLTASTTVASTTIISLGATLAVGNNILTLTTSTTTNSGTLTMGSSGTLVANDSSFTNSGTLTLSNAAVNLHTATFANSGTVTIGATGVVTATDAVWTNTGTVTETLGGKIVLAAVGVISNSAGGGAVTSFGNVDSLPLVHGQITDTSLNLVAATVETLTVTVTSASGITTSQSGTLTETGAATGIFRGSMPFTLSGTAVSGSLAYQGSGTVSYTWTDPQDSSDIVTGSASFTGTSPGGGSSGGGSTVVTTTTTTVTPAPTTVATTVTAPAATTPTATAVSTLESVQTKVTSVIAKIAALPANPTASDLTSVQAEIAAILVELQSIQAAAQPTPQGVALGFNFVRPLAIGLRHADVRNLQQALKTDSSVYPEGLVTGYFGSMTLKAVQKFQEKYGIASFGQPGYGNVGPATRAKLNELYGSH